MDHRAGWQQCRGWGSRKGGVSVKVKKRNMGVVKTPDKHRNHVATILNEKLC